jgi:hypothetical protein
MELRPWRVGWGLRRLGSIAVALLFAIAASIRAQEQSPSTPPDPAQASPPETPEAAPTESAEEAGEDDDRLSVAEMKALSDDDLRALYLETPWRLPDDFGEDQELLERVMRIAHPEIEPLPEPNEEPTPAKPQPNAP